MASSADKDSGDWLGYVPEQESPRQLEQQHRFSCGVVHSFWPPLALPEVYRTLAGAVASQRGVFVLARVAVFSANAGPIAMRPAPCGFARRGYFTTILG